MTTPFSADDKSPGPCARRDPMTLPIVAADTDSEYRHRFHNIVSVYEDPVSAHPQPTSFRWAFHTLSHLMFGLWASSEREQHKRKKALEKCFDHMSFQRDRCSLSVTPFHSLLSMKRSGTHGDTLLDALCPGGSVLLWIIWNHSQASFERIHFWSKKTSRKVNEVDRFPNLSGTNTIPCAHAF